MSDWPGSDGHVEQAVLQSLGLESPMGQHYANAGTTLANSVWSAANTALYMPVAVQRPCTVYKMSFLVAVQSGNYDIGIYDEWGNRLVSKGSTAVPVAGIAITDIADTALTPGIYFLALNFDNIVVSIPRLTGAAAFTRPMGICQQAVGAVTLPNPATFANATGNMPIITAHLTPTV